MDIAERARAAGIRTEYADAWGRLRQADQAVLQKVLDALRDPSPAVISRSSEAPVAFRGDFDRVWLLTCQLYSLRSSRNWGIGDFSDLGDLIDHAAAWGCAGIGINPVHALLDNGPADFSPYAPSSRLFLNTNYIDWSAVEDLNESWTASRRVEIERARRGELVDYELVTTLKVAAAREAYSAFTESASTDRASRFETFRLRKGEKLSHFACFEVLRKHFGGAWWDWPDKWRVSSAEGADELRNGEYSGQIQLVEYMQWIADEQLSECKHRAQRAGMKIGLYLDVAVGVQAGGFDAWAEQGAIARSLSVGAPPDILNTAGQDWGLSAFSSGGLQHRSFEPLREMLVSAMVHAGAIRLDHVLGLRRLYMIPHGTPAAAGVYVDMPFDQMMDVIAEESQKYRCIVIGEDLGTVPDGLREQLGARGVLSYTVMMFEQNAEGFLDPAHYRRESLVTFNTHDLATFEGWIAGTDIKVKQSIGIDPGETLEDRARAVAKLSRRIGSGPSEKRIPFLDVVRALARSPSRILAISIDDLFGVTEQPNVPGTITEHPNWRRRLPCSVEALEQAIDAEVLQASLAERCPRCR